MKTNRKEKAARKRLAKYRYFWAPPVAPCARVAAESTFGIVLRVAEMFLHLELENATFRDVAADKGRNAVLSRTGFIKKEIGSAIGIPVSVSERICQVGQFGVKNEGF